MIRGLRTAAAGAIAAAVLVTAPQAVASAAAPAPVAALIMTGTNMPTVEPAWMAMAVDDYIRPTLGGDYTAIPVVTPEELRPVTGPNDLTFDASVAAGLGILSSTIDGIAAGAPDTPVVVFGYSQSATIATFLKRRLSDVAAPLTFVLLGNPNRPNGGVFERFPGLEPLPGWTFSGATPTDTSAKTVDIARQYDPFSDFPQDPFNPFALANTLAAMTQHDYTTASLDPADPDYVPGTVVEQYGDTTYYRIPATQLPLIRPLRNLGVSEQVLAEVEPQLRELVEAGYDRSAPMGQPVPARVKPAQPGPVKPGPVEKPAAALAARAAAAESPAQRRRGAAEHGSAGARPAAARSR